MTRKAVVGQRHFGSHVILPYETTNDMACKKISNNEATNQTRGLKVLLVLEVEHMLCLHYDVVVD